MPALKNVKHEKFAVAVASGTSASKAYRDIGFNHNAGNASRLKSSQKVAARIAELTDAIAAQAIDAAIVDKNWVLRGLIENYQRAMQKTEVREDGKVVAYRYHGAAANRALELIGKELGMFIDRSEAGKPGDFSRMTEPELRAEAARQAEVLGLGDIAALLLGAAASDGKPN